MHHHAVNVIDRVYMVPIIIVYYNYARIHECLELSRKQIKIYINPVFKLFVHFHA